MASIMNFKMKFKINWFVRFKNPYFWVQVIIAIVAPVLAYFGLSGESMTSWAIVFNTAVKAVSNPYVCFLIIVSVGNAINDPTTKGVYDSARAMKYEQPFEKATSVD